MNVVVIGLIRVWVYILWNFQQLSEIIRRKRDVYLPISDLRIIYNQDGLLVVDKSPELLINTTNVWLKCVTLQMQVFRCHTNTIVPQLFFNLPHLANFKLRHMFHFVNRLDAPTSGLICVAYTSKMAGMAGKAFQERVAKKHYLAAVWGHVSDVHCIDWLQRIGCKYEPPFQISPEKKHLCEKLEEGIYLVEFGVGDISFKWPSGRIQKIMAPDFVPRCWRPRPACTKVTLLSHGFLGGRPASLLLLEPKSGRRHQLRLHCAVGLGGHPIAGDLTYGRIYGGSDSHSHVAADYALPRMMLHAHSLELRLIPKPPFVKGLKKQERVNRAHPKPIVLSFKSTRCLFEGCHWRDDTLFYKYIGS